MMLASVPFTKYTVMGNHFVIVDETAESLFTEAEKPAIAEILANPNFGVGCDNVLFVQRATESVLFDLKRHHAFPWLENVEQWNHSNFQNMRALIFRMFESDGAEAAMCGNGLIAVASHLSKGTELEPLAFVTEVPTDSARVRVVVPSRNTKRGLICTVHMGKTQTAPTEFLQRHWSIHSSYPKYGVERLPSLSSLYRIIDAPPRFFQLSDTLLENLDRNWQCSLVYSGEPHLVLFPRGTGSSHEAEVGPAEVGPQFFFGHQPHGDSMMVLQWLGRWLNSAGKVFPKGVNVCLVEPDVEKNSLRMRSFERGILHETYSCGTGAVAACATAVTLDAASVSQAITVHPFLARAHTRSGYAVEYLADGWTLSARAQAVYRGRFTYPSTRLKRLTGKRD